MISEPLWLFQTRDNLNHLVAYQINDRDRVIFELRHEQPTAFQIHRQVIDTPANLAKRDSSLEHEERLLFSRSVRHDKRARKRERHGQDDLHETTSCASRHAGEVRLTQFYPRVLWNCRRSTQKSGEALEPPPQ